MQLAKAHFFLIVFMSELSLYGFDYFFIDQSQTQVSQPPDVTSTGNSRRAPADRVNRFGQNRSQSSSDQSSGNLI